MARCPVIDVKDGATDLPDGPKHPVVVGTDRSAGAAAAVDFAADRAATASTALEVITLVEASANAGLVLSARAVLPSRDPHCAAV